MDTKQGRWSVYLSAGAFLLAIVSVAAALATSTSGLFILAVLALACSIWWLLMAGTEMDPAVDGDRESWWFLMFWPFGLAAFAVAVAVLIKLFEVIFGVKIIG